MRFTPRVSRTRAEPAGDVLKVVVKCVWKR